MTDPEPSTPSEPVESTLPEQIAASPADPTESSAAILTDESPPAQPPVEATPAQKETVHSETATPEEIIETPEKTNVSASRQPQQDPATQSDPTRNDFRGSAGRTKAQQKRSEKRDMHLARIIEHARTRTSIHNDDIEKLVHVSDATASRYARMLVQRGDLVREGKGRSVTYSLRT